MFDENRGEPSVYEPIASLTRIQSIWNVSEFVLASANGVIRLLLEITLDSERELP